MKKKLMLVLAGCAILVIALVAIRNAGQEKGPERTAVSPPIEPDVVDEEMIDEETARAQAQAELLTAAFWAEATPETVREIVAEGLDLNARDENGWAPIMWAARTSTDPELVETLTAYADFLIEADDGTTVISLVADNPHLKDSELHRKLEEWQLNEIHYQKMLEMQKAADELESEDEPAPEVEPEPAIESDSGREDHLP